MPMRVGGLSRRIESLCIGEDNHNAIFLRHKPVFLTSEIRNSGSRQGFELQGLNGVRRTLAQVKIDSRHRVGRYGVDKDGFEAFLATLDLLNPAMGLTVIDEIDKMELFSNCLRNLVWDALKVGWQILTFSSAIIVNWQKQFKN
jgi:nucleoside-triphosphatase THEP1